MTNWIHLSDLHFKDLTFSDSMIIESLLSKIKEVCRNKKIEFVFITGDLANRGKIDKKNLDKFLSDLIRIVNIEKSNIFFVPGNHDLDRANGNSSLFNMTEKIMSDKNPSKFVSDNIEEEDLDSYIGKQDQYYNYINEFYGYEVGNKFHYVKHNDVFNIIHLNTSWMCHLNSKKQDGNIIINVKKLHEIKNDINKNKITIALGHHGLDFINDYEREIIMDFLSECNTEIYLCGHSHIGKVIRYENGLTQFMSGTLKSNNYKGAIFCVGGIDKSAYNYEYYKFDEGRKWSKCDIEETVLRSEGKGSVKRGAQLLDRVDFEYEDENINSIEKDQNESYNYKKHKNDLSLIYKECSDYLKESILKNNDNKFDFFSVAYLYYFYHKNLDYINQNSDDEIEGSFLEFYKVTLKNDNYLLKKCIKEFLDQSNLIKEEVVLPNDLKVDDIVEFVNGSKKYNTEFLYENWLTILNHALAENINDIKKTIRKTNVYAYECVNDEISNIIAHMNTMYSNEIIDSTHQYQKFKASIAKNDFFIFKISSLEYAEAMILNYYKQLNFTTAENIINNVENNLFYVDSIDENAVSFLIDQVSVLREYELNLKLSETSFLDMVHFLETKYINFCMIINISKQSNYDLSIVSKLKEISNENHRIFLVINDEQQLFNEDSTEVENIGMENLKNSKKFEQLSAEIKSKILESYSDSTGTVQMLELLSFIDKNNVDDKKYEEYLLEQNNSYDLKIPEEIKNALYENNDDVSLDLLMLLFGNSKEFSELDILQNYFTSKEISIKKPQLKFKINKLQSIFVIKDNRVYSAKSIFNKYVIKELFSDADWESHYATLIDWVGNSNVDERVLLRVNDKILSYIENKSDDAKKMFLEKYRHSLKKLEKRKKIKFIYTLSKQFHAAKLMDLYELFIDLAISNESKDAIQFFVLCKLIDNSDNSKDEKFRSLIRKNANENHLRSMVLYSLMYLNNNESKDNYIEFLSKAVKTGDTEAKIVMARSILREEKYTQVDLDYSMELLKQAIDDNSKMAKLILGLELINNEKIVDQEEKGLILLKAVADNVDYHDIHKLLGAYYLNEKSNFYNKVFALQHFEKAREFKVKDVSGYLGNLLITGKKVERNIKKGLKYLENAVKLSDSKAMQYLGWLYFNGRYVPRDLEKSFKYFYLAYENENDESLDFILDVLISGKMNALVDAKYKIISLVDKSIVSNAKAFTYNLIATYTGEYYDKDTSKAKIKYESKQNIMRVKQK